MRKNQTHNKNTKNRYKLPWVFIKLNRVNLKLAAKKIKENKKNLYKILNNKKNKQAKIRTEKKIKKYKNQLKLINYFIQTNSKPFWIIIKYLPVLSPNLRPIIKLKENNIIISEINYLYINIINANNKLKKLRKMLIPEKYTNKEKKSLQTNIDRLINQQNNKTQFYKEKKMRH